ncbi:MAG: hypothetical protein AAGI03_04270 [Pseudomonadota bacterium]
MANNLDENVLRLLSITKELGYPLQCNAIIAQGANNGMTDREARAAYDEARARGLIEEIDRYGMARLTENGLAALEQ